MLATRQLPSAPTAATPWLVLIVSLLASLNQGCVRDARATEAQAERVPGSPDEFMAAGKRALTRGDDVRAEHYFSLAMREGFPAHDALRHLLDLCIRGARYSAGLTHAKRYLHNHDGDAELHYLVATLHDALGQSRQARRALSRVLTQDPSHPMAHYLAALIFHRRGQELVRARFHAERYLELTPDGPHAMELAAMLEELSERIPGDA